MKRSDSGIVGGVCSGISESKNINVIVVRILFTALLINARVFEILIFYIEWVNPPSYLYMATNYLSIITLLIYVALWVSLPTTSNKYVHKSLSKLVYIVFGFMVGAALVILVSLLIDPNGGWDAVLLVFIRALIGGIIGSIISYLFINKKIKKRTSEIIQL